MQNSLKKNSLINLFKTVISLSFPLITFPYVSRILGVENIGKVNFANSIMNYFVLIAGLGISNYAIREGAKVRDDQTTINKLCSEILIINIFSTVFAYIAVFILIYIPIFSTYTTLLLLFSTTLLFNLIGINWVFNIYEEFTYITIRTAIFQVISIILLLIFVKSRDDYIQYAGILVFSSVGANVFNIFYAKKFVKLFPKGNYEIRKHIKPIFIIFAMSIASTIYLNLDMTMLGLQSGNYEVGLYSAASKISKIIGNLIASVCAVFLPRLAYYLETKQEKKFNALVDTAFYYILGLTFPVAAGLFVLSKEVLLIISGVEFINATPIMLIKAPNIIFSVLNGFIAIQLFIPLNKEKESLYATIIGAIINCLLNYLMIPIWGATGAAIATICAEGCVLFVCIYHLRPLYSLKTLFGETWKYLAGSIGILFVGKIVHHLNLRIMPTTLVVIIFGIIVYFFVLLLLKSKLITDLRTNCINPCIDLLKRNN